MSSQEPVPVAVVAYTEYPFDMRIRREVETLEREGYEVDVIAVRSGSPPNEMKRGRVVLHEVPMTIKRGGKLRYFYQYALFFLLSSTTLVSLNRRRHFALVHVHSLPDFQVFCALPLRFRGTPVLLDLHEALPEILSARFGAHTSSIWVRGAAILEQVSGRFATHIVTANDGIKQAVVSRGLPADCVSVIYNVGDDPAEPIAAAELRRELGLPHGDIIVHAGGINPERDLETVIQALALLPPSIDVHLVVAGNGDPSYIGSLSALAQSRGVGSRFHFVGRLPLKRAKALMSLSSVGLISLEKNPLTDLAWPTRIVEFANLGKPLLIADLRFIRSVLGDSAHYYRPGDPGSLAAELAQVIGSPSPTDPTVAKARRICSEFGLDEMRRRLLEVYHDSVA